MNRKKVLYAQVILPIKFSQSIYYTIERESFEHPIQLSGLIGTRVEVIFANRRYCGVIYKLTESKPTPEQFLNDKKKRAVEIKPVERIEELPSITPQELAFWEKIAQYYMCTLGEVYKAAYPNQHTKQERVNAKIKPSDIFRKIEEEKKLNNLLDITLSNEQGKVLSEIENNIDRRIVFLQGVTGSGKTQIYLQLAKEEIKKGKNVLYLVPEIAISRELEMRLKKHLGERLLTYHSNITPSRKRLVRSILREHIIAEKNETKPLPEPIVILGTRSATMLPLSNLGLIIVDEEHDASYKQSEPAPRYNGRDAALFLSQIHKCRIILGSATPSLETLYNCARGLYHKVVLPNKFYSAPKPDVIVIDTLFARKTKQMHGSFSNGLINKIEKTLARGEQVIIFSHLRSYAPFVTCRECGNIFKCPHCNVALSYHKFNNSLSCHYCGFNTRLDDSSCCPNCKSQNSWEFSGAGSERIEEEVRELFPNARISRYDADIAQDKRESERVLERFANGETDILIGTQMISKSLDFENVTLVAVVQTDTLLAQQDFRADEKAFQLLTQLMGRCGRRDKKGEFVIQTRNKKHPVIERIRESNFSNFNDADKFTENMLSERRMFLFPPFIRLIKLYIREKNFAVALDDAKEIVKTLRINLASSNVNISAPYTNRTEKVKNLYQQEISIKFARNNQLGRNKEALSYILRAMKLKSQIIIDVDPL